MSIRGVGAHPKSVPEAQESQAGAQGGGDRRAVALICVLWAVSILLVDPRGNFPVTDDWAFIESVRAMVDRGELHFSDWGAMNLVSQILWGSLFGLLFGVDYDVMRASTLIALLVAGLATYWLARTARVGPSVAALAALIAIFNPLAFSLAFSFMTDVPYLALQMAAMALIASGYRSGSRVRAAIGWSFGIAALLCRQVGVSVALGAAAEGLVRTRWSARRMALSLLPLAAFVLVQFAYQSWLIATGIAPRLYGRQANDLAGRLFADPLFIAQEAGWALFWGYCYIGVFALPMALLMLPGIRSRLPERARVGALAIGAVVAAGVATACVLANMLFPSWGNTIRIEGLGADLGRLPYGAELFGPIMPHPIRLALTYLASVGGAALLACLAMVLWERLSRRDRGTFDVGLFALAAGLALFVPIMFLELRFDRYFIPIIPCLLVAIAAPLAARRASRVMLCAAALLLVPMAAYSVAATHDFMSMKRVQWRAYSDVARHVRPEMIDGSWVLNGQASFGRYGKARNGDPTDVFGWYVRADYMVGTQTPPAGYETVAVYPVERWMTWGKSGHPVLVHRRAGLGGALDPSRSSGGSSLDRATARDP